MLTQKGLLTDIGSWYLGGAATNNIPEASFGLKVVPSLGAMIVGAVGLVGLAVL